MRASPAVRRFFRNRPGVIALAVVLIYLGLALGFEIYATVCETRGVTPIYDEVVASPYQRPGACCRFGADYQGRSVGLRALAGSATAMKVGIIAGIFSCLIGTTLGLIAGFYGGKADDVIVWLYSTFAAMPSLLFILAFALLFSRNFLSPSLTSVVNFLSRCLHSQPEMLAIYIAIGLTGWVSLCRAIRTESAKLREMPFVKASQVAGVRRFTILFRHILPNVFHLVIIYFTLNFASAVAQEVMVSYLGLGAHSVPSWGVMISDGQERLLRGVWWEITAATGMMFFLVLALNILGDAMSDSLDSRM